MARDLLRSAVTRQLAPVLEAAGYRRLEPKRFIKIQGDIIKHVSFQSSRWGGGFYVHAFANTPLNPLGAFNAYRVGVRLQGEPNSNAGWSAESAEAAEASVASASRALSQGPLEWLDSIASLRDYVFEYVGNPNSKLEDFEFAIVLARAGQVNRPKVILDRLCLEGAGGDESEYDVQVRPYARELRSSFATNSVQALISEWRSQFLERHQVSADAP